MNSRLEKVRLGDIIELREEINSAGWQYPVMGMNKDKIFMPTVANLHNVDLKKYKIVRKGEFAFSGMQTGRDGCIRIAQHVQEYPVLVSPAYTTFIIKDFVKNIELLPSYVFLFFNRMESDRYGAFISDSSVRANLDWTRFCDIEIPVPDRETQRRLVDVWEGLDGMKRDNETQAAPLMELCMSYIKKIGKEFPHVAIGQYIKEYDARNVAGDVLPVLGLNREKQFIPTAASLEGVDLSKYKLIRAGNFVFSGMQTGRDGCIRISLYSENNAALVSPAYMTFDVDSEYILPDFFFLCFLRQEMDRYGSFISDSSVRANLDWSRFLDISIPIPPKPIQQAIVDLYACAKECKDIAEQAGQLRKIAAPALMQKAIHLSTLTACP